MYKKLLTRFKSSEFLVNVSKLTSATAIAQLISIGTAPILYRIYDRVHYGTLGLYMAITGVIGVFSTLQYMQTIMLEKEDEDAINAMWLNRLINVGFTLLVSISILLFSGMLGKWANNPALEKWFWLIPLSIFFSGQNEIFKVWANRKKEYNVLTLNGILMAIIVPIVSISLGLLYDSEMGLFIGLFAGQSIPALILYFTVGRKYDIGFSRFSRQKVKALAATNVSFPIYSLPQSFIGQYINSLPVFLLNSFVGAGAVGDYNLAIRMLGLPIQFIGGAISTVFSQEATRKYNLYGEYKEIFLKTLKSLILISIVPVLILTFFSTEIFTFFFGEKWLKAGIIAGIMAPLFALKLINSPLSYGFYIHKLLKLDLLATATLGVGTYLIFHQLLTANYEHITVIKIYTIFYCLIYILMILINYKLTKRK